LDWNLEPVTPGRGSAIFLHLATPDYAPTAGCIALSRPDLLAALAAGLSAIRVEAP
jgi:L,D-peptidoglycan transpeptidase YkuD (ErfK/YbiS/YcfS/YnhG family)